LFQFFFIFFIYFIFLVRENFSKKVVWTSFGITKSLTAGNLKILVKNSETQKSVSKLKNRRQNRPNRCQIAKIRHFH